MLSYILSSRYPAPDPDPHQMQSPGSWMNWLLSCSGPWSAGGVKTQQRHEMWTSVARSPPYESRLSSGSGDTEAAAAGLQRAGTERARSGHGAATERSGSGELEDAEPRWAAAVETMKTPMVKSVLRRSPADKLFVLALKCCIVLRSDGSKDKDANNGRPAVRPAVRPVRRGGSGSSSMEHPDHRALHACFTPARKCRGENSTALIILYIWAPVV